MMSGLRARVSTTANRKVSLGRGFPPAPRGRADVEHLQGARCRARCRGEQGRDYRGVGSAHGSDRVGGHDNMPGHDGLGRACLSRGAAGVICAARPVEAAAAALSWVAGAQDEPKMLISLVACSSYLLAHLLGVVFLLWLDTTAECRRATNVLYVLAATPLRSITRR
jgi:hypothetical protein